MTTPSKAVNVDGLGYALATPVGSGIANAEIELDDETSTQLTAGLDDRRWLFVKVPEGEGDVLIGGSDFDSDHAYLLKAQEEVWLDVGQVGVLAMAVSGSSMVRILESSSGSTLTTGPQGVGTPAKAFQIGPEGHVMAKRSGAVVKQADISVDSTSTPVELTAGLANRCQLIIKLMGEDENNQRFIFVGEDPSLGASPPGTATGFPVWARYELVLNVGPDNVIKAIMSATGSALDVRVLEVGY